MNIFFFFDSFDRNGCQLSRDRIERKEEEKNRKTMPNALFDFILNALSDYWDKTKHKNYTDLNNLIRLRIRIIEWNEFCDKIVTYRTIQIGNRNETNQSESKRSLNIFRFIQTFHKIRIWIDHNWNEINIPINWLLKSFKVLALFPHKFK